MLIFPKMSQTVCGILTLCGHKAFFRAKTESLINCYLKITFSNMFNYISTLRINFCSFLKNAINVVLLFNAQPIVIFASCNTNNLACHQKISFWGTRGAHLWFSHFPSQYINENEFKVAAWIPKVSQKKMKSSFPRPQCGEIN